MFRRAGQSALRRASAAAAAAAAAAPPRARTLATAGGGPIPPSLLNSWYNTFGRSTAMYASWLVMFIVVGEFATGKLTDYAWTANNYGKTFATVEWSKFDNFDEKEEDDDDDE